MYTHIDTNTELTESIDRQISSCHDDLVDVQSYLKVFKGYIQPNEKSFFSFICGQQEMATETLVSLQNRRETIFVEVREFYENQLAENQKLDEQRCSQLKMDNKRLSESSNFYKAKAEKYHRNLKNKEQQLLLLQQQQKDQQQQQDICIEELKDALHDQEEDHKAQLDDIKKFSDDIINMLTMKLQEEREMVLTLQAEICAAVSSPQLPPSSAHSLTPSPSMLSISSSRYSTRQPSPSPASTPCVSDFSPSKHNTVCTSTPYVSDLSPSKHNTVCTSTPMSSPSHLSHNTFIHPAATIPPLRYSNATPSTPSPPPPQPKLFRPPPPPMPSISRTVPISSVENDKEDSLPVCSPESARRWFEELMAAGQKTEPVNEDSYLNIIKFANGEYECSWVTNERYTNVEEEVVTQSNKLKVFFKEVVPQLFKSKKEAGGNDTSFDPFDGESFHSDEWYMSLPSRMIDTIDRPRKRDFARRLWGKLMK
ncbi:hypothetical protein MOSE0_C03950 [Monosporozyma servazzii]